jgi:hypothetical protein
VTKTVTQTATPTKTKTVTKTITETRTITQTRTATKTFTSTRTPSITKTPTSTIIQSPTITKTFTKTPFGTRTMTKTITPTKTLTATRTFTFTKTAMNTRTPTFTISTTHTVTPTMPTLTITQTPTILPTIISGWNFEGYSNILNRIYEGSTIYNNKFYEIAGFNEYQTYKYKIINDVWNSTNGLDWAASTQNAAFSPRYNHAIVAFNGLIFVIGGKALENGFEIFKNDVWQNSLTSDYSFTRKVSSALWTARQNHTVVEWNSKLWLIGGDGDGTAFADVWNSTNGITWIKVLDNAPFGKRYGHVCLIYDSKIWIIGGNVFYNNGQNDVWNSSDGINWNRVVASTALSKLGTYKGIVYHSRMFLIGGESYQATSTKPLDVFESADGVSWYKIPGPTTTNNLGHSCFVKDDFIWVIVNQRSKPVYKSQ